MSESERLGILTSGGDAPGLNAVIRAVVKTAHLRYGWSVLGIEGGFEGLLGAPATRPLAPADVVGLLPRGGSILGCTNRGHFGGPPEVVARALDEAAAAIGRLDLRALIMVGGDGSHRIASALAERGCPIVGVPKTIDRDLPGTELTFGFDTAAAFATEAIDRVHTTAESHGRVIVVEVMGRHAGWIALAAGIAGGADVILIPEIPYRLEAVGAHIEARAAAGRRFSIVVVAEGARSEGGDAVYQKTAAGEIPRLGGVGVEIAAALGRRFGMDTRAVTLGHLQRGGQPMPSDRLLASALGAAAVHAAAAGHAGHMIAWRNGGTVAVPFAEVVGPPRTVPRDHDQIRVARDLGIGLGE